MKKIICPLIIALAILMIGCDGNLIAKPPEKTNIKPVEKIVEKEPYIKIMTSNKFLYHMVKDIVKDRHQVDYMLKGEEDQWKFTYTEDSLSNVSRKDLFIYSGAGYEPWVSTFLDELKKGKVGIVNASRGARLLTFSKPIKYMGIEYKENPYYWLDIDDYKIALSNIKNPIQERDPKNREFYEDNFTEKIKAIDKQYKDMKSLMDLLKKYTFVVIGDNLDYFIKSNNIKIIKFDENAKISTEFEKTFKKLPEIKDIVLLYDNESKLKEYDNLINTYNMKPISIITNKFDLDIYDILELNYDSFLQLPLP